METAATPMTNARHRIPLIGVVGGVGSGKSAVANWVSTHAPVAVIDADKLGHEALLSVSVKAELRARFGDEIFDSAGNIVRAKLANRVFGVDANHLVARRDLERIVHPAISRQIAAEVSIAVEQRAEAVLLDAAILLEAGWRDLCELVVFIETPAEMRLQRVQAHRGWTKAELQRREESQWDLSKKRQESDLVIVNDRELEYAGKQLLDCLIERNWVAPPNGPR
jgi:dephospho-CoA kinase